MFKCSRAFQNICMWSKFAVFVVPEKMECYWLHIWDGQMKEADINAHQQIEKKVLFRSYYLLYAPLHLKSGSVMWSSMCLC